MNTLAEIYTQHPQANQLNKIIEAGWVGATMAGDKVRMADDFHNTANWERQAMLAGGLDDWVIMNIPVDTGWHNLKISRVAPNIAGFQVDDTPEETTTTMCRSATCPSS